MRFARFTRSTELRVGERHERLGRITPEAEASGQEAGRRGRLEKGTPAAVLLRREILRRKRAGRVWTLPLCGSCVPTKRWNRCGCGLASRTIPSQKLCRC